jgi:hypothetical protein
MAWIAPHPNGLVASARRDCTVRRMEFCTDCGARLEGGWRFCRDCGAAASPEERPPSNTPVSGYGVDPSLSGTPGPGVRTPSPGGEVPAPVLPDAGLSVPPVEKPPLLGKGVRVLVMVGLAAISFAVAAPLLSGLSPEDQQVGAVSPAGPAPETRQAPPPSPSSERLQPYELPTVQDDQWLLYSGTALQALGSGLHQLAQAFSSEDPLQVRDGCLTFADLIDEVADVMLPAPAVADESVRVALDRMAAEARACSRAAEAEDLEAFELSFDSMLEAGADLIRAVELVTASVPG